MSHHSGHDHDQTGYARIVDGVVVDVTVVSQADSDEHGAAFVTDIMGLDGYWVQVCDNMEPIHHNFACIGDLWDEDAQAFHLPPPDGISSWSLDENFQWQPPVPYPGDLTAPGPLEYRWDEDLGDWVETGWPPE